MEDRKLLERLWEESENPFVFCNKCGYMARGKQDIHQGHKKPWNDETCGYIAQESVSVSPKDLQKVLTLARAHLYE